MHLKCPSLFGPMCLALILFPHLSAFSGPGTPGVAWIESSLAGGWLGSDTPNGLAFGDINGDGFDDLVMGLPLASPNARPSAGQVAIIFGSATPLSATSEIQLNPTLTLIHGAAENDWTGSAVSTGDVNNDGYDDILIGAPGINGLTNAATSRGWLVYGNATFASQTVNLSPATAVQILSDQPSDRTGSSTHIADVNGDGEADLIIGARWNSPLNREKAGAVWVINGGDVPLTGTLDLGNVGPTPARLKILGGEPFGQTGSSVGAGDINGDGFTDILVGAQTFRSEQTFNAGRGSIIYTDPNIISGIFDLQIPGTLSGATHIDGAIQHDAAGTSISAADIDGDGIDDLLLGIAGHPVGDLSVEAVLRTGGRADILFGKSTNPSRNLTTDPLPFPQSLDITRTTGFEAHFNFGNAVVGSDMNGDGHVDFAVGAWRADRGLLEDAGEISVFNGGPLLKNQKIEMHKGALPDFSLTGRNAYDLLGSALAGGGDFNGDGIADLAGSAVFADFSGDDKSGEVALILGSPVGDTAETRERIQVGNAPLARIGGPLTPVLRLGIGYDAGQSPSGEASTLNAILTRSKADLQNLAPFEDVANVYWHLTDDRVFWNMATLELHYLDSEISGIPGLNESELLIFQSPSTSGPWSALPTAINAERNTATAQTSALGYFIIAKNTVPVELSEFQID